MRKSIFTTVFFISSLFVIGCNSVETDNPDTNNQVKTDNSGVIRVNKESANNSPQNSENKDADTTNKVPVETAPISSKSRVEQPKVATIKNMVQGDLQCYVTLVNKQGKQQEVGASFDICSQEKTFLNKKVNLTYNIVNVNDCESNEPCGKTKRESLIVKMDVVGSSETSQKLSGDTFTLSNNEWTIKLSNYNSWNGINGTGNVKYYGCDSKGKCIKLSGGKVSCRNGKCVTVWENGEYVYAIEDIITEDGNNSQPSTLIVRKGSKVILRTEGLKTVSGLTQKRGNSVITSDSDVIA